MVSLGLPALSDIGFRTGYSVAFAKILPPVLGMTPPPVPIPTIVPVSSSFFEADIDVSMDETEAANTFSICIHGLGDDIYSLLVPQKTVVRITLGYDDGGSKEVMTGLLTEKSMAAGDQWYVATLKGTDFVFDQLQRSAKKVSKNFQGTVGKIAAAICSAVGVDAQIPDNGPRLETISFNEETPFQALSRLAQIPQPPFSLQAKDGKLWMGNPDALGVTQTTPIDDGAVSHPIVARGATPDASPMDGQDFEIAGFPSLRPSDLVILGTDTFRVQSVTHRLSREGGYTCRGRAFSPGASHEDAQQSGRPGPALVARQLRKNLLQRDKNRPAVDIGDVKTYNSDDHTITLDVGHDLSPEMTSPTTDATLRDEPVPLESRPIASPFAFYGCGLMVPLYPGMRSMLVHSWNEPGDAVSSGFVWTSEMKPPKVEPGDWRLCLPTELGFDGKPTGNTVEDLISQQGQRVIQVKGLRITIGSGLLPAVGDRPTPGEDETLMIEADDNQTRIILKAGQIEMTDGLVKLSLAGGKISIS
jgi:hypothetical protein